MKKWSCAHICAYLSLAISVTMFVLWCCNVGGFSVVSLDSFVGVVVALLAIVVTLAIAWQIFNSIELKDKIKKMDILKEKLDQHEKVIEERKNISGCLIFGSLADIELYNSNYMSAFRYLMISLEYSMSLDTPGNINNIFNRMDISISKMIQDTSCSAGTMGEIQDCDKKIRESKCFDIIKSQYVEKYSKFISKVKVTDDKQ